MQTLLLLLRHAYPTSWDDKKSRSTPPHQRLDPGLAAIGHQQAQLTAAHLAASGGVHVVISSPFRRCLETADVVAAACKAEVVPDWRCQNGSRAFLCFRADHAVIAACS